MEGSAATTPANIETKTPGKLVSAGKPVRAEMTVDSFAQHQNPDASNTIDPDPNKTDPTKTDQESKKPDDPGNTDPAKKEPEKKDPPKMTEAEFLAFAKEQGIDVADIKTLKEKVAGQPAPKTPEQVKADEAALEQRLIAAHMKRGGTIEQYTELKQIAAADPITLGLTKLEADILKEGFSKEDTDLIIKRMQLQYSDEEIADLTPEEKAKVQKEAAFGLKKQENRGKYIQQRAKDYLDILQKEVQDQDAVTQKSTKHTSKVEEAITSFVRTQNIQLGEYDGQKLDPVELKIPDEVLATVKDILADPAKIDKLLYNDDGELNLDFLVPHLVASVSRETAAKHAFLQGQTKQVEIFKSKFGDKIPDLGGPPAKTGTPGKLVKAGKPEYMRPGQT